jgi:sugar transferase (PEP-CTERM system associated)
MTLRIFRHFVAVPVIMLGFCEILLIFLAWHFYLSTKPLYDTHIYDVFRSPSLHLSVLAGAVMIFSGFYNTKVFIDYRVMAIQVIVTLSLLVPVALIWGVYGRDELHSASSIWMFDWNVLATWLLCILFTRTAFLRFVDLDVFKRRVLVLGTGRKAARIAALATERSIRHFVPAAYLRCGTDLAMVPAAEVDLDSEGPDVIADCARELRATEIVVATDDRRGLPVSELLRCRTAGIRVIDYLDFIERETEAVDLAALQPGWLIFSDGFRGSGRTAKVCKRCFDIALALTLSLFTLPLMLLTCLIIMIGSPGPVLYRQERVGVGGRPFTLLKFRSMRTDAEKDGAPRWARASDTRVTRVGKFIRKLRIDELPQLWNVLRGDMSFVGPRPERPAFVEDFIQQVPFYAERHCVKPGITGWAQINYPYGASLEDARNKLSYDLYYVKNHSLFLDLIIVLQTIRVILWADGAR